MPEGGGEGMVGRGVYRSYYTGHRDNGELGQDDGPADGSGYFL